MSFIHPELAADFTPPKLEFAGFVSSLIGTGTSATDMAAVRKELKNSGIEPFDAYSSEIMDLIAWHSIKIQNS